MPDSDERPTGHQRARGHAFSLPLEPNFGAVLIVHLKSDTRYAVSRAICASVHRSPQNRLPAIGSHPSRQETNYKSILTEPRNPCTINNALIEPVPSAFLLCFPGPPAAVSTSEPIMTAVKSTFPGGSRGKVNRAGSSIRDGTATPEDIAVINTWREAHRHVINSFQSILRNRTRSSNIVVAQRHKRQRTIFDKLTRFPRMQLSRMDDVAGCRLIFDSIETLERFRKEFHEKSRFNHKLRNHPGKYNYILNPKASGYRGIHDVYEYDVNSSSGRDRKGLLIELQYRTTRQHAWATAVELVGLLTAHQPKFDRGDEQVRHILRLASEIIARSFEDMPSSMPHLSSHSVVEQFNDLDARLTFMRMLRGLNKSNLHVPSKRI